MCNAFYCAWKRKKQNVQVWQMSNKTNLLWHENHPKQVMVISAMLEAKVLIYVQSNFAIWCFVCVEKKSNVQPPRLLWSTWPYCVRSKKMNKEREAGKFRSVLHSVWRPALRGNLRARLLARCLMGTRHSFTHTCKNRYIGVAEANSREIKRKSVKRRKTNVECYALSVLWTTKRFVWRLQFFVLFFFPLWIVPVFKLNDYVMFPLYTSVSVYY